MIKKKRCRLTECERDALRADIVQVLRRDGINPSDSQWPDFWEQDDLKEWVAQRAGALNMEPATFCKQVAKVAYDCIFVVGRKRARDEAILPHPSEVERVTTAVIGCADDLHQNAEVIPEKDVLEDIIPVVNEPHPIEVKKDTTTVVGNADVLHQKAVVLDVLEDVILMVDEPQPNEVTGNADVLHQLPKKDALVGQQPIEVVALSGKTYERDDDEEGEICFSSYSSSEEEEDQERKAELLFREITLLCLEEMETHNGFHKDRLKKLRLEWLDCVYGRRRTKRKVHHYSAIRV